MHKKIESFGMVAIGIILEKMQFQKMPKTIRKTTVYVCFIFLLSGGALVLKPGPCGPACTVDLALEGSDRKVVFF